MIPFLRFITTPIFALSFLWHMVVAFAWHDGKITAISKVYEWQDEDEEDEEDK